MTNRQRFTFPDLSLVVSMRSIHELNWGKAIYFCKEVSKQILDCLYLKTTLPSFLRMLTEIDQYLHYLIQNLRLVDFDKVDPQVKNVEFFFERNNNSQILYVLTVSEIIDQNLVHPADVIKFLSSLVRDVIWAYDFKLIDVWPRPVRYGLEKKAIKRVDTIIRELLFRARWKLAQEFGEPPLEIVGHGCHYVEWNTN